MSFSRSIRKSNIVVCQTNTFCTQEKFNRLVTWKLFLLVQLVLSASMVFLAGISSSHSNLICGHLSFLRVFSLDCRRRSFAFVFYPSNKYLNQKKKQIYIGTSLSVLFIYHKSMAFAWMIMYFLLFSRGLVFSYVSAEIFVCVSAHN